MTAGGQDFVIDLAPEIFKSFDKVQATLVKQTHGEALMTPQFDTHLWTNLVSKMVFNLQSTRTIKHFRLARNTGLQYEYLVEKSFGTNGALCLQDVEYVYPDAGNL